MGKADFFSPKAISNRIKAKGLQKLRWFCQMCEKQCRDENGFRCHCMSESHQRRLLLVSENPKFMDYFSDEFKNDFLELLRRRFGTKRVHNNIVYNEYISNREHVHMNSTQWETLTEFTKWLGREGFCKVDETPKGWYVQYIDRDLETIRNLKKELKRKKKQALDDEERRAKFIEQQVRRGREGKEPEKEPVFTKRKRGNEEKISFKLAARSSSSGPAKESTSMVSNALKSSASGKRKDISHSADSKEKKKKSALDEIMEMEAKEKKSVKLDNWIRPDKVVKVVTKSLGDKYYKKKAVIRVSQRSDHPIHL
ncbi:DNA/RNA-binding protein KIN17-like isoform 2-T2 [Clarias gariepinus]|uniref:DNA/RNA-binding protein KIN17-like isoform X2 n=1 Tax=Clarias gariepinus TaxID=13013 RepID=UPI00234C5F61|nr:DNA/RNA-binding protein KIN17-like isoform X2 [Clarias gariepinus]